MSIHVALHHRTHYEYDRPVGHSPHVIRLRPAPHSRTPILAYSQRILPKEHFINWQHDPFLNHLARVVFPGLSRELLIEVDLVAEMAVYNPFDFFLEEAATQRTRPVEPWMPGSRPGTGVPIRCAGWTGAAADGSHGWAGARISPTGPQPRRPGPGRPASLGASDPRCPSGDAVPVGG